jgi:AraC-like DNA-binding protein
VYVEASPENLVPAGELIAEIGSRTPLEGPNRTEWRGLTCYRFERPQTAQWNAVHSLTICFVLQGRKRVRVGETDYFYDERNYLVLTRGMRFQAEIQTASPAKPYLSLLLQVDPALVKRVYGDMKRQAAQVYADRLPPMPDAYVSPIDTDLVGAGLRFFRSLATEADRRVLGPIYLQEIVYRVLQSEQCTRMIEAAVCESDMNPVAAAIRYMQEDLSRPLTVQDIAEVVAMSQSAFAHLFKATTGVAPYQFVKRLRLERARALLVEQGVSVSDAAVAVGYSSLSHFITEFKRHFGVTPRLYAESLRDTVPLSIGRNTMASG